MQSRSQIIAVASSIQLRQPPWETGKGLELYVLNLTHLSSGRLGLWFCFQREDGVKQKPNFEVVVF